MEGMDGIGVGGEDAMAEFGGEMMQGLVDGRLVEGGDLIVQFNRRIRVGGSE